MMTNDLTGGPAKRVERELVRINYSGRHHSDQKVPLALIYALRLASGQSHVLELVHEPNLAC